MGALHGLRVLEFAGIGPGPFCGLMLADMGADVLRIDRPQGGSDHLSLAAARDLLGRGRRSAVIDLKEPEGRALALRLVERSDALIEGFRPGVMERLGLGPEVCLQRNTRLVYGRMTGWGQAGPLAQAAGHDINYIALSGALHAIGRRGEPPVPPLNLVGDFGGGGLLLAFGIACALLERARSGQGQVVDAAMVDGAALLMTLFFGLRASGRWSDARGQNLLDSGAHYYEVYETKDGRHVAVGALEPKFYGELLKRIGLDPADLPAQHDAGGWDEMKRRLQGIFAQKTRDEWCALLEGSDACFAPVLSMGEAPAHPHNRERQTFTEVAGVVQPAPAPRLSRTPGAIRAPAPYPGQHTRQALADWGIEASEIERLHTARAIG